MISMMPRADMAPWAIARRIKAIDEALGRPNVLAEEREILANRRRIEATDLVLACLDAQGPPPITPERIAAECDAVKAMLLEKNAAYGDSALNPVRVFSQASPVEQLLVRIDDKLSRLARGSAAGEDVIMDLIGYLVLLRIARNRGA